MFAAGVRSLRPLQCLRQPLVRLSTISPKVIKSSIPMINKAVENATAPKFALVEHPYILDGYREETDEAVDVTNSNNLFAVVDFSGSQYKVSQDDVIVADKMDHIDIGTIISLDKVLLVGSKSATLLGRPLVPGATVMAVVEEMARDKKVMTLKYRRRKNSKRLQGFRREITILRIMEISLSEEATKDLGV
mmetsp:Transcript_16072/g.35607  ORF Transcript_16072/g.35607 Transcript_16072/m.35607 type:complete len:191 (-) Transcript_16072:105-677(-)